MATWHPPIPAGMLYSEDALKLGPALAMLVWCYDRIQRDGTIEVQLSTAVADIGKPYGTIKDWWKMLRAGGFFCEEHDRGKRGWVVRLKDDWIDWHVMGNNYPVQGGDVSLEEQPSSQNEGRIVNLETVEVPVKAASRRRQGGDVSFESSAYKEDHHDHKIRGRDARARDAPTQVSLDFMHEACRMAQTKIGKKLTPAGATRIANTVTDMKRWDTATTKWAERYGTMNVDGLIDWYEHPELIERRNGRKPHVAPTPEWSDWKDSEPGKDF